MAAQLWVDVTALVANYQAFLSLGYPVAAVVKADGYGCGVAAVSQALEAAGCSRFFVATAAEGSALRAILPRAEVYVFEGPLPDTAAKLAAEKLIPVINTLEQLALWRSYRQEPLALHVDTGVTRLGLEPPVAPADFQQFKVALLMSHLACADTPDHPLNTYQQEQFEKLHGQFSGVLGSLCNSAGALAGFGQKTHLARIGIGLYGGNPQSNVDAKLAPVVALEAEVLQVRDIEAGRSIGYGADYQAQTSSQVAVVNLGYADGYLRHFGDGGSVQVGGKRCPIVGRISMDLTCIDVTGLDVRAGDSVWFLDARYTINHLAEHVGTIPYEVLTSMGQRLQRRYCNGLPRGALG